MHTDKVENKKNFNLPLRRNALKFWRHKKTVGQKETTGGTGGCKATGHVTERKVEFNQTKPQQPNTNILTQTRKF